VAFDFGPARAGWLPIAGDWNGDGVDTVGLFNPAAGSFFLRNSHSGGAADVTFFYGPANGGWRPIAGDWNGDGVDSVGLHHAAGGAFFLRNSHTAGAADVAFFYGPADTAWRPLSGDWNGDGTDTVGLFNPTTSGFYLRNSHAPGPADASFVFGPAGAGWLPVMGDWNGPSGSANNLVALASPGAPSLAEKSSGTQGVANHGNAPLRVQMTLSGRDQAIRHADLLSALFQADTSSRREEASGLAEVLPNRLRAAPRLLTASQIDQVHAQLLDWAASRVSLN
jgi:hypothetical protein